MVQKQHATIDEKAELESQYDDDFEQAPHNQKEEESNPPKQPHLLQPRTTKTKSLPPNKLKSGQRSKNIVTAAESVNTSI